MYICVEVQVHGSAGVFRSAGLLGWSVMDPKIGPDQMLIPSSMALGGSALGFPPIEVPLPRFPPVNEHVVQPEVTRDEVIRGRRVLAQPALEPHGDAHAEVGGVVRFHVRPGYRVSVDLLTRVSEGSNFATDLSVRREGIDPKTGQRHLEELSFEIVNEQALRDVEDKARELVARGVRRVFAVLVKRGEICEWSRDKASFVPLEMSGELDDPCFVRPMALRALFEATLAEVEVVRALERKGNAEIEAIKARAAQKAFQEGRIEGRSEGKQEGRVEGQIEGQIAERRVALRKVLQARFGDRLAGIGARIDGADGETLARWFDRALVVGALDDVFAP